MGAKTEQRRVDGDLQLPDGGALSRRRTKVLRDGSYLFEDDLAFQGDLAATIITCSAWLLELYEIRSGELFFIRGDETIRPLTNRFGVLYSPFSISKPCFRNAQGKVVGFASFELLPDAFATGPIVFDSDFCGLPISVQQVIDILRAATNSQTIDINPKPSRVSLRAKELIDASHLVYPSIAQVAARLQVTHEHLSRQFKRDYGMSPNNYLRRLRLADAPLRLARGEEIVNVSHDVGYNDLSRFYKQFRKTTDTSPGVCKTILRRNSEVS